MAAGSPGVGKLKRHGKKHGRAGHFDLAGPQVCPNCGAVLEALTSIGGGVPDPGTVGCCLYCGTYQVLGEDLKLRKPHPGEIESLSPQVRVALEQARLASRHWIASEAGR